MRATEPRLPWRRAARPRERVADAVFGGEELAVAGHPPEQHPPGRWDDVVDGEGSDVGGGGLAGLGVLPEAAPPAVAGRGAATPRRAPRARRRRRSATSGGAGPVEPRGRQARWRWRPTPRAGGWPRARRPAARSQTSSPPSTRPPVNVTARRAPAHVAKPAASTSPPAATRAVSKPAPGSRGPGSARSMPVTAGSTRARATAEAARRYGANGADLARAGDASRWRRRRRRATAAAAAAVTLAVP